MAAVNQNTGGNQLPKYRAFSDKSQIAGLPKPAECLPRSACRTAKAAYFLAP
jgi:hypothetical protein